LLIGPIDITPHYLELFRAMLNSHLHPCSKCGETAVLYSTKRYHLFSTQRRFYCQNCQSGIEKREDLLLIFNLVFAALFVTAMVFLNTMGLSRNKNNDALIAQKILERDFDGDGQIDLWELQATQQQIDNFKQLGYPWEVVESGNNPTRAFLLSTSPREWSVLERSNAELKNIFNFPDVMSRFIAKNTNPASPVQIDRVFLTSSRDVAFILKKYSIPPSEWPPVEATPSPAPKGKQPLKKEEKEFRMPPSVTIEETFVCYEQLKRSEGLLVARLFGIPDEKLPPSFQTEK
jgi:hypothetical protein